VRAAHAVGRRMTIRAYMQASNATQSRRHRVLYLEIVDLDGRRIDKVVARQLQP
jgi:hypothetical protein